MPTIAEIAQELYAAPPEGFVAARNEYASKAKQAGDRATAAQIAALRRPTVAAWLVNLLALRRGDLIDQWLSVGESIRQAQTSLDGQAVRRLSAQRRDLLDTLLAEVRRLAGLAGHPAGEQQPPEPVAQTLNAALSDAEVGRQVRDGRLVATVSYAGFGQAPTDTTVPILDLVPTRPNPPGPPVEGERPTSAGPTSTLPTRAGSVPSDVAKSEVRRDELRLRRARHALEAAQAARDKAARNLEAVTAQLAEVQRRVDRAQRVYDESSTTLSRAHESLAEAEGTG